MTGCLRVIDTGRASGRWNTALSAALLRSEPAASEDACVRFYRFDRCVLLGANQAFPTGAALVHCTASGIEIARRVTGGGNVYMSPTMLAWDVVMRQWASVESMSHDISAALAAALRALGYADVTHSDSCLALAGRKLSGAAMSSERCRFLYQGTLLIEDESEAMAAALGLPVAALAPHIASLNAHNAAIPDGALLQATIASHLAAAFALAPEAGQLTAHELALAEREHAHEIGTDAFVRGDAAAVPRSACA